ncbi:hypothetical protein GCM10022234_04940 [Aeromicrobium panaciterrae]|uniref:helix-turn-helix transcriptional regulator n=1 Tax=Aeromicrobium panaciterrae TaxID=363861 RepID=UPI0031D62C29
MIDTLGLMRDLAPAIAASLGDHAEVVIHDLSLIPASVVAVSGNVTGRTPGAPATNVLLEHLARGETSNIIGYDSRLPDGRRIRSSTILVVDTGTPVAALCINVDLTMWESVHSLAESTLGQPTLPTPVAESFVLSVGELKNELLQGAISQVGVPVELMRKEHKIQVVRQLRHLGMFLLRDGVDTVADALGVTRYTIYNYMREIEDGR